MIVAERFYFDASCSFCGEECSHMVDFELYIPATHNVHARISCTHCLELAELMGKDTYTFLDLVIEAKKWDEMTNAILHIEPDVN